MELVSNYYRTRAHYPATFRKNLFAGSEGTSLCSTEAMPVTIFDKAAHEAHEQQYHLTPKPIESLPLCKKCERIAKKRTAAEG